MNNNYENKFLDAVQILVDNAVSNAGYDKTIRAVISKCVNQSTGKYVVKYQDSTFYAYSNDLDSVYNNGTSVYILVPGNDMSQTKTILGSVDKLGTEYINLSESNTAYQTIGSSVITSNGTIPGVSSYKKNITTNTQEDSYTIYDREAQTGNVVDVDTEGAELYLRNAQYMEIGGTFLTNLTDEQKRRGNYGLVFDMDFKNGNEIVNRQYIIDIDSMTGNPYSYTAGSEQSIVFKIDGENFDKLNSIKLECKNFPHTDTVAHNPDIFVKDIILKALSPLERDEIVNNSLTFITKQGIYFNTDDNDNATRLIETEVKIKGKILPSPNDLLRFYWFKQDSSINLSSPNYLPQGGPGWKCINDYTWIDETNNIKEYVVDVPSLTVVKNDNEAKENDYKCVVIYNNQIQLEKNITIYNNDTNYIVSIESDSGNDFRLSNGSPTLTCNVVPAGEYTYVWTVTDSSNRTTILEETENSVGMRVSGNKIYNIELGTITDFNKYTCSVFLNGNLKGKSDIVITNNWDSSENSYSMLMENGDQVFKYNEKGIAPTNKSLDKPIALKPLYFNIYDSFGQLVDDNKIKTADVTWYVPINNTMLTIVDSEVTPSEEGSYLVYRGTKTLSFVIAGIYNNKNMNNTIKLTAKYDNKVIATQSEFVFLKEGEIGSNGTDFVCKIVPNVASGTDIPAYPIYTATSSSGDMNYQRPNNQSDKWFKVSLYKDGVEIYNGITSGTSQEDKAVTVAWSILKNNYGTYTIGTTPTNISDSTNFNVGSSTGAFTYTNVASGQDRVANIAKVTVTYDGATYYATMPIILVKASNTTGHTYNIDLVENTGFRYVMYSTDGLNPLYDSSNPFTLKVYDGDTDITESVSYSWAQLGSIYNGSWTPTNCLIPKNSFSDSPSANCRPIEKFDGLSVNNALECVVSSSRTELARIYLPIHFYLNRYGNAALNGWDGNHVEINSNGGFILAPQIGAGKKDNNNAYTGIFMGTVREGGSNTEEIGLFGYNAGERTIALDAEDGSARFGKSGQGQIVIDPGANTAKIASDSFRIDTRWPDEMEPRQTVYTEGFRYVKVKSNGDVILLKLRPAGTTPLADDEYRIGDDIASGVKIWVDGQGLEIDLIDPHILFGNGNFRVDSDGQVYATGFVTVKELEEGDYNIPGINVFNVDYTNDTVQFEANAQLYPIGINPIQKTITLNCLYKDETTTNYTTYLLDSNGNPITTYPYPSASTYDANGLRINITQASVSGQAEVTFIANTSQAITNVVNSYKFRFTHPHSPESIVVDKLFYANLVVKGTSVTIKGGPYADVNALCAAHQSGNTLGDSYTVGTTNAHLYVFTNGNNTGGRYPGDWSDVGQIQGAPGENAKGLYISATSDIFKKASGANSYSPSSITITPFFQNTSMGGWYYSQDGGVNYTVINLSSPPSNITYDSNTKALTIPQNCSLYTSDVSVLTFKCTTDETYATSEHYYNTISIGRVDDGAKGVDGKTVWVATTEPTYANNKYTVSINDLDGPTKTPEVGEIIFWDNRYQYPITAVNTLTVEAENRYDMRGANGNNTAVVTIYKKAASQPNTPTYGSGDDPTYTFSTHTLSAAPSGWSTTMAGATDSGELWASTIVAYGNTDVVDISHDVVWSSPQQMTEKGDSGTSPFYAYLTNAIHTFAVNTANTASTELYAYKGSTLTNVQFKVIGGVVNTNMSTTDFVNTTTDGISFKVNSKDSYSHPQITFKATGLNQNVSGQIVIEYLVAGEELNRSISFSYSTSKQGDAGVSAKALNIEAPDGLLFKSDDGGSNYTPSTIKLIPVVQNTTFGSWYCNGSPVDPDNPPNGVTVYTSSSGGHTINELDITSSSSLWDNNKSLIFEARDENANVKDSVTITRLSDAINTFIKYSDAYPTSDSDMYDSIQTTTKYIGVYNGSAASAPSTCSSYGWKKFVGNDGNGISSIVNYFAATENQSAPAEDSSLWKTTIAQLDPAWSASCRFLWKKEVVTYSIPPSPNPIITLESVYGQNGQSVYNISLTNEAQVIAGDETKPIVGSIYYTDIKGYLGTTQKNLTITKSQITNVPNWMTVSLEKLVSGTWTDQGSSVTDMNPRAKFTVNNTTPAENSLSGRITIPITFENGPTMDKVFTYSTALKGEDGDGGYNTATVALYQRTDSPPTISYQDNLTYDFENHAIIETLPGDWEATPPMVDGTYLWATYVTVSSQTSTASIAAADWSSPIVLTMDSIVLKIEAVGDTIFRNSQGSTRLIAHVYVGSFEQTVNIDGKCGDLGTVKWYKNGTLWGDSGANEKTISPSDINDLAYVTCKLETN